MLRPGDGTSYTVRITKAIIDSFTLMVGDENPIHYDPNDAQTAHVRAKLGITDAGAPGTLVTAFISRPLQRFGGKNTIVLGELGVLRFVKSIQAGDELTIRCIVEESLSSWRYRVAVLFKNQKGEDVVQPTYAIIFVF
ncbi:MAG: hypothetical protein A2939_01215 [Parcubacteria group bacterium RIFCSPLOWO2_01_FULL_48_18]|nr:MAG: hypothetical protein A2939_01215 [Parcubacteria group bacterium RIFCSPLOWO2_01_FULL_48_18]OHB23631.1 MAG: hypothetical protein A3J67_00745 [Parcubacteria group bacterium RIFCSPHIGHO2_02_FULL_48_10b]